MPHEHTQYAHCVSWICHGPHSVTVPEDVVTALGEKSYRGGHSKDSAVSVKMVPLEHDLSFQL